MKTQIQSLRDALAICQRATNESIDPSSEISQSEIEAGCPAHTDDQVYGLAEVLVDDHYKPGLEDGNSPDEDWDALRGEVEKAKPKIMTTDSTSTSPAEKDYFVFNLDCPTLPIGRITCTAAQIKDEQAVAGRFGLDTCDTEEVTDKVTARLENEAADLGYDDWNEFTPAEYNMAAELRRQKGAVKYCVRNGEHTGEPHYRACAENDNRRAMWMTEDEMLRRMNHLIAEHVEEPPLAGRPFDKADRDEVIRQILHEAPRR